MNDIGESLQSEELQEQRKEGKREQTDEEVSIFSGEEEGSPQSFHGGEKPAICTVIALARRYHHTRKEYMLVFLLPT